MPDPSARLVLVLLPNEEMKELKFSKNSVHVILNADYDIESIRKTWPIAAKILIDAHERWHA